jgi:hypothetical protein
MERGFLKVRAELEERTAVRLVAAAARRRDAGTRVP